MINFKDFMVVDYAPGMPDEIKYRAQRRKRTGMGGGPATEALTMQQRLQRARSLRKNRAKLRMGRMRAMRRIASKEKLMQRARRTARNMILLKLTKNIPKSELTFARKQELEKKLEKMGPRIDRIAKKILPKIRKAEFERKRGAVK